MNELVRKLPNWLTYSRLALIPIFVVLMHEPSRAMVNVALTVFIVAALTDWVDGYLARRYSAVSDFGKLLDPIADKILVMAALVSLVGLRSDLYGDPWVPAWMVVLILAREIWVTGLRAIAASAGRIVPAGSAGKLKSLLQMLAIVFLMLHDYNLRILGFSITCQLIGLNLLILSIAFSFWGAAEYTRDILFPAGSSRPTSVPEEG